MSGTTFTPVVNLNGAWATPLGNVTSTMYAVNPRNGLGTLATYSPLACAFTGVPVHFAPIVLRRKSREPGLVAYQRVTEPGASFVRTRIAPSLSMSQLNCGIGALVRMAWYQASTESHASVPRSEWSAFGT